MTVRKSRGQVRPELAIDRAASAKPAYKYEPDHHGIVLEKIDRPVFKVLQPDGRSPFQGYTWPLPTENADGTYTPGEWLNEPGELITCVKGLHVAYLTKMQSAIYPQGGLVPSDVIGLHRWWQRGQDVYLAEVEGPVVFSAEDMKYVAGRVRLIRPIPRFREFMEAQVPTLTVDEIDQFEDWKRERRTRIFMAWVKKSAPALARMSYKDIELLRAKTRKQENVYSARVRLWDAQLDLAHLLGKPTTATKPVKPPSLAKNLALLESTKLTTSRPTDETAAMIMAGLDPRVVRTTTRWDYKTRVYKVSLLGAGRGKLATKFHEALATLEAEAKAYVRSAFDRRGHHRPTVEETFGFDAYVE